MITLIVGASGATGRLLVEELLSHGQKVRIVVRSLDSLPKTFKNNKNLTVIQASFLDLTDAEMVEHVSGCNAVASCLGHEHEIASRYWRCLAVLS